MYNYVQFSCSFTSVTKSEFIIWFRENCLSVCLFVFAAKGSMVQPQLPLTPTIRLTQEGAVDPVDIPPGESFSGLVESQCSLSQ